MTKTFHQMGLDEGLKQGRDEGRDEGWQEVVLFLIDNRYNPTNPQEIEAKVQAMTIEQLKVILTKIGLPGVTLDQLGLVGSNGTLNSIETHSEAS